MHEIYTLTFSVCAALIAAEVIARLFPEKSSSFAHMLVTLLLLLLLLNGIVQVKNNLDFDFDFTQNAVQTENTFAQSYAEKGVQNLKDRLGALLDAAGVTVAAEDIDVWYTQDDAGNVEIERVRVRVRYATDADRARAVLHSVLTDAIPVDVYM